MGDGEPKRSVLIAWIRGLASVVLCVALLGGAAGASYVIFQSEPKAQSESAVRKTAALVETMIVERGSYRPVLTVLGEVEPAREVVLSPRVGGQVNAMEPSFVPGRIVDQGAPLVHIDPADFERVVTMRESELHQIEAELAIEEGRQRVAQQEFELLGEDIDPENRMLVLREPQIASIRARVGAAQAALERAELDLARTTIAAPFDAQILSRAVNVGSQVSAGDALGRLVGVDEYWVIASVPLRDLRWIEFADPDAPSSVASGARVRHTTAWEPGAYRDARVDRLIGTVDEMSRLAQVLVTIPDPLSRRSDGPRVILGTVLQLQIEGKRLEGVIRIEREYLRQDDTVWVMVGDVLDIRAVTVAFRDADFAYISEGLKEGEEIVTTSLATVTEGLPLRRVEDALDGVNAGPTGVGP